MVCYVKTCSLLVKNTEHLKANPNSNIFENLENKESWNGITSKVLTRFFLTACPYWELFWSVFSRIRTRITRNTDTFYAVPSFEIRAWLKEAIRIMWLKPSITTQINNARIYLSTQLLFSPFVFSFYLKFLLLISVGNIPFPYYFRTCTILITLKFTKEMLSW